MEALKSIILLALGVGVLLTWSLSKKYTIIIKAIITALLLGLFAVSWFVWPGKPNFANGSTAVASDNTVSNAVVSTTNVDTKNAYLTFAGSNTIGDNLIESLISDHLRKRGATDIKVNSLGKDEQQISFTLNGTTSSIYVFAHGTGTGFTALSGNKADVCMASNKDNTGQYTEHVIAVDGIAVIVNKHSGASELSLSDIRDIYSGNVKDWSRYGGSGNITLYGLDNQSGTNKQFTERVMNGSQTSNVKMFEKSEDVVNAVGGDENAIGYVSYAFLTNQVKSLAVRAAPGLPAVKPTALAIQSEKYPISRRLYLYTTSNVNSNAQSFISFVEGDDGQNVVQNSGFVNLSINTDDSRAVAATSSDPTSYSNFLKLHASKLTTTFRFKLGSSELDSRSEADLQRVKDYASQHSGKQIILCGYTDASGTQATNLPLSQDRANVVSGKVNIPNIKVFGFGSIHPESDDPNMNRRVEVWVK
jgi:phosphate transport system substrate-binding protein